MSAYHLKIAKPAPPVRPEQNRLWKVVEKVPRTFFLQNLNIHFQAKVPVFSPQQFWYFDIQSKFPLGLDQSKDISNSMIKSFINFSILSTSFAEECWKVFWCLSEVQPCPGVAVFWQSGSFDLDSKVNRCQSVKFKWQVSTNAMHCNAVLGIEHSEIRWSYVFSSVHHSGAY